MKNKEKQIEEMAKITCSMYCRNKEKKCANVQECDMKCLHHQRCEALYNAGYRKQGEVVKEFFDEIEKLVSANKKTVGCATYEETIFYIEDFIEDLAELKKKYTGEKEDEQVH